MSKNNVLSTLFTSLILTLLTSACGVSADGGQSGGAGTACAIAAPSWSWNKDIHSFAQGSTQGNESSMYFNGTLLGSGSGLNLKLFSGTRDFPSSPMTAPSGPIDLSKDTQFSDCGACVYYWQDAGDAGDYTYYFASAGTMTVSHIDTTFKASLSNLVLKHVTEDGFGHLTPASDGCKFTVGSVEIIEDLGFNPDHDLDQRQFEDAPSN